MNAAPSIGEQIRLIVGLRWRMFRNSLRTLRGRLDAAGLILLWLLMSGLMIGGGVAMSLGAYSFLAAGHAAHLAELFWAVLLFWQLYPFLSGLGGAPFEFGDLLRFPLRYAAFYVLSLAYGLFDPAAVVSLFWLFCLSMGVGIARPALLPWALLLSAVFGAMSLALSRAVSTWADRWLGRRRTREILGLLIVVVILSVQFVVPMVSESAVGRRAAHFWFPLFHAVFSVLPPALPADSLARVATGARLDALVPLFFLSLYALAFFWFLHLRLAAQYRGENLSEAHAAPAPAARHRAEPSPRATWRLPGVSGATAALFEREAHYMLRNWPVLLQFGFPVFFLLVSGAGLRDQAFFVRHGDFVFPVFVGYAFLSEMNWIFNSFGYDGTGVRFLLLAPVRFREIVLGKNLLAAFATFLEVLALWLCVRLTFGPLRLSVEAATLAAALYALLVNLAVGNFISVAFPIPRAFGTFRRGRGTRGTAMLVGLATEAALVGSCLVVFLFGQLLDRMGLAALIFLALSVLAAIGYAVSLRRIDRFAHNRREMLAEELCQSGSVA